MVNKGTVKKKKGKVRLKGISKTFYCGKGYKGKGKQLEWKQRNKESSWDV